MASALSQTARRRLRSSAVVVLVLVIAAAAGRLLIDSGTSPDVGAHASPPRSAEATSGAHYGAIKAPAQPARSAPSGAGAGSSNSTSSGGSPALSSQVQPVGPDIVRTATVGLGVSKGEVSLQMQRIADIAAAFGGYVESSSLSGGTAKSAPSYGQVVVLVEASDFDNAVSELSTLGKVTTEKVSGQDVTGQIAENAATISVLQQEVNLLQSKLSEATDISTFLQIDGQLAPVQQQLQQLQSQQAVLQSSVTLSTVTVNLTAPGAPVGTAPKPKPNPDAGAVAWRYLSRNTLFVVDGLAVAAGWALPLLVLGALGWLVVTKVVRRKRPRPGITTA